MFKLTIFFLLLLLFSNCSINEEQILGEYVAVGYVNTYDTIKILKKGVYERLVYNKNNKLALHMKGNWRYKDGVLSMGSFFLNLDRDIDLYPELLSDTTMRMGVLIEAMNGRAQFCTGYNRNENCYQKISK